MTYTITRKPFRGKPVGLPKKNNDDKEKKVKTKKKKKF